MVMPLAFKVCCTSAWAAVVFAWGLMNTKAAFVSPQSAPERMWLNAIAPVIIDIDGYYMSVSMIRVLCVTGQVGGQE